MSMRRSVIVTAAVALLTTAGSSQAQEVSVEAWEELREVQAEIRDGRDAIVKENLPLTGEEAKAFWPVYMEYRKGADKVAERTSGLIEAYAANVDQMSEPKADAFFQEWLAIEREALQLREEYAKKVRAVLPGKKAIRFFQVESKLDALMDLDITMRVPLVE